MPIIDKIVDDIDEKVKNDNEHSIFRNKTGFWGIVTYSNKELSDIADYIINCISDNFDNNLEYKLKKPTKYEKIDDKTKFSLVWYKGKELDILRKEDSLERLIKLVNKKENKTISDYPVWENQCPIPDIGTTSHVDIVFQDDKKINFVELKQWDISSNPPTWAIVEDIKNLFAYNYYFKILMDENDKKKRIELKQNYDTKGKKINFTILAPKEYYENFFMPRDNRTIRKGKKINSDFLNKNHNQNQIILSCLKLFENLEQKLSTKFRTEIKISMKYFDFNAKNDYRVITQRNKFEKEEYF